jgi:hypothetical protein
MKKSGSLKSYNPRKSKKHIFFFNVLPVALAAAVLLGIAGNSAFQSVDATAKTSLPYIETKKTALSQTGGSFHILEVTPEKDNALYRTYAGGNHTLQSGSGKATEDNYSAVTGNFGYLINGQEPIGFDTTLGYFGTSLLQGESIADGSSSKYKVDDLLQGKTIRQARENWAEKYLKALETAGIASKEKDKAPLTLDTTSDGSGYYKELLPWEDDVKGEKTVTLNSTETDYVTATATENLNGGSFSPSSSSYEVQTDGNYLQNISLLNEFGSVSASSMSSKDLSGYVFYKPVFTEVDFSKLTLDQVKTTLYQAQKIGFPLIFSKPKSNESGTNTYSVDQLATGNFKNLFATSEQSLEKALKKHTFSDDNTYAVITGITGGPVMGSTVGKNGGTTLEQLENKGYYYVGLDVEIPFVSNQSLVISKDGYDQTPAAGFFACNPRFYNYVGKGNGTYDLTGVKETDSTNTSAVIINYSTIRYVGGYTNNNWFLRHSLDVDDDSADSLSQKVYVDCVSPDDVSENANSENGQTQAFQNYDLVVISGGLDLFSDSIRYRSDASYSEKDLETLVSQLKTYLDNSMPVLVDKSALSNTGISDLLSKKEDGKTTYKYMDMSKKDEPYGAVYRNVYVFNDNGQNKAIASDIYTNQLDESQYKNEGTAFYAVYHEIAQENALRMRKNPGTTDTLDIEIDEATGIRYIINYKQQRNIKRKDFLKVLDIEPESTTSTNSEDGYPYYDVSSGTANNLNNGTYDLRSESSKNAIKAEIQKFLPDFSSDSKLEITTVSTRTLAGLTDDITETYDLVYIGDNRGLRKQYRDTDMNLYSDSGKTKFKNSLVYYNIGDEYWVSNTNYVSMNGILDKEYSTREGENDTDTFRYSGNDITANKQKELESFIKQGFPVVVSDGLVSDMSHDPFDACISITKPVGSYNKDNDTLSVSVEPQFVDNSGVVKTITSKNGAEIHASDLVKCTYEWYYFNNSTNSYQKIDGETGSSITISNSILPNVRNDLSSGANKQFKCCLTSVKIGDTTYELSENSRPGYSFKAWHNRGGADCFEQSSFNSTHTTSYSFPAITESSLSKVTVDNNSRLYETLSGYSNYGNVMSYSKATTDSNSVESYASLSSPEIKILEAPKEYNEENQSGSNICGNNPYINGVLDQSLKKLTFKFKIINQTDVNPTDTTYTAKVYADLNSDGVFDPDDEDITSLKVNNIVNNNTGGEILSTALKGGITEDGSDAPEYQLSAQLPESLQGAFTWKLVIYENSEDSQKSLEDCPKDSYKGISYVGMNKEDGKITIRILQLNSDNNYDDNNNDIKDFTSHITDGKGNKVSGFYPYDLEKLMAYPDANTGTGGTYVNYFGKKLTDNLVSSKYIIQIKTIKASTFKSYIDGEFKQEHNNTSWLKYYDMLILGFGDGYSGPDQDGLKLVEDFIDTGKAVLFCHDNSSYRNLSKTDSDNSKHDSNVFTNAFYYNTMLRSKSFMDVYGVTDPVNITDSNGTSYQLGGQQRWGIKSSDGKTTIGSGILAQGKSLDTTLQKAIKALGYSVAYKPVSGGNDSGETVDEVHGFTDSSTAHRLTSSNGTMNSLGKDTSGKDTSNIIVTKENNKITQSGGLPTQKISQVNKGLVTSYPYNINKGDFKDSSDDNGFIYTGASDASMKVSWTHAQWYQLNTNADNIVVWYTVENQPNENNADLYGYNDCVNNYYIYNCGNITYTGAGHDTDGWFVTEEEAKLFVNTMIAAYRVTAQNPSAQFVANANSSTSISSQSIQVETDIENNKDKNMEAIQKAVNTTKIYFKITDNSVAKGIKEGIKLYNNATSTTLGSKVTYSVDDNDIIDNKFINIFDPKTGKSVNNEELKSGKVYYFTLPTDSQAYKHFTDSNAYKDLIGGAASSEIWLVPYNKVTYPGDTVATVNNGDPVPLTISLDTSSLFDLG